MGTKLSKTWGAQTEVRILVLGLEGAGKTTFLRKLNVGEILTTPFVPGIEMVNGRGLLFAAWDIGRQGMDRSLWSQSLQGAQGIIFVVDSNDEARMSEARDELSRLFNEDELRETYFLIIANKQDLPNAMKVAEITGRLGLPSRDQRTWRIQTCSATSGEDLDDGMDWFVNAVLTG
ncbi:hypothetical protein BGZ99_008456 [Dissophora globulifera]|uniref:ADP-ribosylation factor n=1 Tax=Dissophora globulifera TaxID=979702 RepID=A0A9P6UPI5_9FUNG|nr:hypothetical protein BGZ99_008456 [Dissophora globulifera]